jgi:hypothetical protein
MKKSITAKFPNAKMAANPLVMKKMAKKKAKK